MVGAQLSLSRLRVEIHGAVQGVGFRPFVYRLATGLGLTGWVINDTAGVFIEVEGPAETLRCFLERLPAEVPPRAIVQSLDAEWLEAAGYTTFEIRHSDNSGAKTVLVLPDLATCPDCLAEVFDPADRRFGYPFTNCTNCGPRFSIIQALPYDRPNTTMRQFIMCPQCQAEYDNPLDRRFHAQPNACPVCGPQVVFVGESANQRINESANRRSEHPQMRTVDEDTPALRAAAEALRNGQIVAMKGLGGFLLLADATNDEAVGRLRARKRRGDKPFAIMVRDLAMARQLCHVSPEAAALLTAPEAPIVLLPKRLPTDADAAGDENRKATLQELPHSAAVFGTVSAHAPGTSHSQPATASPCHRVIVSPSVAPDNPYLGIMLPYMPLHHLLLREIGVPVVATSGNLSDEPICTDNDEAFERLRGLADAFLIHDRPIARHVDDSVAWIVAGAPRLLRRARGYAPLPVLLKEEVPTILAVGAHLKNTVALSVGRRVFISQHIGDLETPEALAAFERVIADFLRLYEAEPVAIAHDMHPDYLSTKWAVEHLQSPTSNLQHLIPVQHHHAHLAACLAENRVEGPALGVTWDGTGYGPDGTVWGGEFLLGDAAAYQRVAHLRPFRLPGGDAAVHEPRRVALALLWELYGEDALAMDNLAPVAAFTPSERRVLGQMLAGDVNAPLTTSMGRLFDGVAALAGLHQRVSYEGQAAMRLEFMADMAEAGAYPLDLTPWSPLRQGQGGIEALLPPKGGGRGVSGVLDWQPLVAAVLADLRRGTPASIISARFHNGLVRAMIEVAQAIGQPRVALTGGCFQNRILTERAFDALTRAGFEVLLHRHVPPNDGGISLGQVAVAAAQWSGHRGQWTGVSDQGTGDRGQ